MATSRRRPSLRTRFTHDSPGTDHGDRDRPGVPHLMEAGPDGCPGVDRIIDDGDPPPRDAAWHRGKAVPAHVPGLGSGMTISGQEGRSQDVGDGLGQERATVQGTAHRVDLVPCQPVSQPADVRPEQGWPQEQRVKVQPDIAVIPGAQVEVR